MLKSFNTRMEKINTVKRITKPTKINICMVFLLQQLLNIACSLGKGTTLVNIRKLHREEKTVVRKRERKKY